MALLDILTPEGDPAGFVVELPDLGADLLDAVMGSGSGSDLLLVEIPPRGGISKGRLIGGV